MESHDSEFATAGGYGLTPADRALLVRVARSQALKAASVAIQAALAYADIVQEHGDSGLARKILDAYVTLGQAKAELAEVNTDQHAGAPTQQPADDEDGTRRR